MSPIDTQPALTQAEAERGLILDAASYQHNPAGYVKAFFPWGTGELEGKQAPATGRNPSSTRLALT